LAFDGIYRRYFPAVYRYVRARVDQTQEVEDITSQVFVEAMQSLPRYTERGMFAAWLFTITRRLVTRHMRLKHRVLTLEELPRGIGSVTMPEIDPHVRLMRALDRLSPDRREALHLRFFAGLSIAEIAEVMNRGEGAVKMLLHRGLSDLRERLSPYVADPA
jgi:RNA polymerase sigma-70 factor (ECF subfamily)